MIKTTASAEEIRSEILRRIQGCADLGDAYQCCDIPLPQVADPKTNGGCNWTIASFSGVADDCLPTVKAVTAEVMREFELAPSRT